MASNYLQKHFAWRAKTSFYKCLQIEPNLNTSKNKFLLTVPMCNHMQNLYLHVDLLAIMCKKGFVTTSSRDSLVFNTALMPSSSPSARLPLLQSSSSPPARRCSGFCCNSKIDLVQICFPIDPADLPCTLCCVAHLLALQLHLHSAKACIKGVQMHSMSSLLVTQQA